MGAKKKKYIDAKRFAERYRNLEIAARHHLSKADPTSPEYQKWLTQAQERMAVRKDLEVFPGIELDEEVNV